MQIGQASTTASPICKHYTQVSPDAQGFALLGQAYSRVHDYSGARDACGKSFEIQRSPVTLSCVAGADFELKNYKEAAQIFDALDKAAKGFLDGNPDAALHRREIVCRIESVHESRGDLQAAAADDEEGHEGLRRRAARRHRNRATPERSTGAEVRHRSALRRSTCAASRIPNAPSASKWSPSVCAPQGVLRQTSSLRATRATLKIERVHTRRVPRARQARDRRPARRRAISRPATRSSTRLVCAPLGARPGGAIVAVEAARRRPRGGLCARASARPSRRTGSRHGLLPLQQRRHRRARLSGSGRRARPGRRLRLPPRQRYRSGRRRRALLRLDARLSGLSGHGHAQLSAAATISS